MEENKQKVDLNKFYFDEVNRQFDQIKSWYKEKKNEGYSEKFMMDKLGEKFGDIIIKLFIKPPSSMDDFSIPVGLSDKQKIICEFEKNLEKYELKKNDTFVSDTFENLNEIIPHSFQFFDESEFMNIVTEYAHFTAYQMFFKPMNEVENSKSISSIAKEGGKPLFSNFTNESPNEFMQIKGKLNQKQIIEFFGFLIKKIKLQRNLF